MSGKAILIVDDERKIVDILSNFLTMEGFDVKKTYDGQEALNLIKKGTPVDLMLLDEKMPVMGGTTLMKEMKKIGVEIPVILLTGSVNLLQLSGSDRGLYKNMLIKPVRLSELLDMVNEVLKENTKRSPKRAAGKKKPRNRGK